MSCLKKLYGRTIIDSSDSEDLCQDYKIELEYYQIENQASEKPYGIDIVKKKIANDILNIEEKIIPYLCHQEQDDHKILEILVTNKVTPVVVDDIIEDLTKKALLYNYY